MRIYSHSFPALISRLVWVAIISLNSGYADSLLPNPFFEAIDDLFQPLDWEFHSEPRYDLISIAYCPDSPAGESVVRITGASVTADDPEPVLARVDTGFTWDPGSERLSLQFHYRRVSSGTEILPVRFRLEIAQEPDPVEMLAFPAPAGFLAPDINVWYPGQTWTMISSADTILAGPVDVVGFQIQRSTAYLPENTEFYLDGLILIRHPVDVAAAVLFDHPASGDDLSVELPLLDWQPGMEIILGDGEQQQPASDVIETATGIMALFESVTLSPGWYPLIIETGGDPLTGGPIPLYPATFLTAIEPSTGSSETPTEATIHGSGWVHGMTGQIGDESFPLIIDSPTTARATIPPQPPSTTVLQAMLPWDRIVEGDLPFTYMQPPMIEWIEPDAGPPAGSNTVMVYGTNFVEGAVVFFDQLAAATEWVGPDQLRATVPPSVPFYAEVRVVNPDGVTGTFEGSYRYEGRPAGDFDGDGIIDGRDLAVALEVLLGGDPPVPVATDLDGDGRIGLADAHILLQGFGRKGIVHPLLDEPPAPAVSLVDTAVIQLGESMAVVITNVPFGDSVRLRWGDGTYDDIPADGIYDHIYERPGVFNLRFSGETNGIGIAVEPGPSLTIDTIALEWQPPLETCMLYRDNDDPVPEGLGIELSVRGTGSGPLQADIVVVRHAPDQAAQTETIRIDIESLDLLPETATEIPLDIDLDLSAGMTLHVNLSLRTPSLVDVLSSDGSVGPPLTAVRRFVTPGDCENTRRELEERQARLAACRERCDALAQRLEEARQERDGLEAMRDAVIAERDAVQTQKDNIQAEYDTLFGRLSRYLNSYGMTLVAYPVGTTADEAMGSHRNFIGRYRLGAAKGVGVAFDGLGTLSNATRWYDHFGPPTFGHNMSKLRLWLREIVEHQEQIDELNAEVAFWQEKIDEVDAVIADLEAELADCLDQCDALQQEIDNLIAAHGECLKQLERQRRAQDKIDGAAGDGERAEKDRQRLKENADRADDFIDERAGSPSEAQPNRDDVQDGRNHGHDAEDEINAGRAKLAEARAKLADGLTEEAELLVEQAREHFDEARDRIRNGNRSVNGGLSGAGRRRRKVCEHGEIRTGFTATHSVWTNIEDFHITPQSSTPEKWGRQLKNKDNILQGLRDLMRVVGYLGKLQDATGVSLPLGGTSVSDPVELAESIVDAHLELFSRRYPMTVWIDVSGYTAWSRVDWLCVYGRWESERHTGRYNDTITGRLEAGTIWGGNRESRQKQLQSILTGFMRQNNIAPPDS